MGAYYSTSIGSALGKIVSGTIANNNPGTAVQVTATSTPIAGVWLNSDTGNGNLLVVGDSSAKATASSQQGIVIVGGNTSTFLPIDNLNKVYFDVITSGDKLCYAYLQPATSV